MSVLKMNNDWFTEKFEAKLSEKGVDLLVLGCEYPNYAINDQHHGFHCVRLRVFSPTYGVIEERFSVMEWADTSVNFEQKADKALDKACAYFDNEIKKLEQQWKI